MMTGFEKHGIERVRTTSLNLYRSSPWAWALIHLGGHEVRPNEAMVRGTATEAGLETWLLERDVGRAVERALKIHDDLLPPLASGDAETESRDKVARMVTALADHDFGNAPWTPQVEVSKHVEVGPGRVRLVGHVDFWEPRGRKLFDLKTSARTPRDLPTSHMVQGGMYAWLLSDENREPETPETSFLYAVPLKRETHVISRTFTAEERDAGRDLGLVTLRSLETFLRLLDRNAILEMAFADPDNWAFRNLHLKPGKNGETHV